MPAHQRIRRLFFPVVILISISLSSASWAPDTKGIITPKPTQQDDFADINPTFEWGVYLNVDSRYNYISWSDMEADDLGNIYILSTSTEDKDSDGSFTGEEPSQMNLHKVTKDGILEWQVALETDGNSNSYSGSIALDGNGNIFVSGGSEDPVSPYYTDGINGLFVAKFDSSGTLLWNTIVEIPDPYLATLSTDAEGNVYICGEGDEKSYDGISAIANLTLAKVNPQGTVEWIKSYGNFEYNDLFTETDFLSKIGSNGFLYVIGDVNASWGEPIHSFLGQRDIFVAKFDRDGSLLWNTFLGLNGTYNDPSQLGDHESFSDIEVDTDGNIYISGESHANWGNPLTPISGTSDSFLAKIDDSGNLLWNTFLGSIDGEGPEDNTSGIELFNDHLYVYGASPSNWGNPIQPFDIKRKVNYISQFNNNGALAWNTFFNGTRSDFLMLDEMTIYIQARNEASLPEEIKILGTDQDDDNDDLLIAKINIYGSVDTYRPPSLYVPEITLYIPTPLDISTDPKVVGTNVLLAVLLMLPFAIAVDLFSRIFSENEEMLNQFAPIAWIGTLQKRLQNIASKSTSKEGLRDALGLLGVVAFYGLVFSLLDKTWSPFTIKGVFLFISMAFAFGLVGLLDDIVQWRTIRKWGHQGEFTVRPANIFLAAVSTTVSRLLALVPGLMFGSPEALRINEDELSISQNKTLVKISMFTYIVIGLTAWLPTIVTTLIQRQDISENQKNLVGGLEAMLLVIFAVALENVFVQLVGISDGLGKKLKSWNKWTWGIALALSAFAFLHTLLNPHYDFVSALQQGNIVVFVSVSATFIMITFMLNFYLRYRNKQKAR